MAKPQNQGRPDQPGAPSEPPRKDPPVDWKPGKPPVKPGPGRPAEPGRPATLPPVKPPSRAAVVRSKTMRKVFKARPKAKRFHEDPADAVVRCWDCKNWMDQGNATAACKARNMSPRWYFQMCPAFEPLSSDPVTIPQVPDPVVIPDDPNNEIP